MGLSQENCLQVLCKSPFQKSFSKARDDWDFGAGTELFCAVSPSPSLLSNERFLTQQQKKALKEGETTPVECGAYAAHRHSAPRLTSHRAYQKCMQECLLCTGAAMSEVVACTQETMHPRTQLNPLFRAARHSGNKEKSRESGTARSNNKMPVQDGEQTQTLPPLAPPFRP